MTFQNLYENSSMHYMDILFKILHRKRLLFLIFQFKTYRVGTRKNRLSKAVLTSTHSLCFAEKIRKNMYIPANPSFSI